MGENIIWYLSQVGFTLIHFLWNKYPINQYKINHKILINSEISSNLLSKGKLYLLQFKIIYAPSLIKMAECNVNKLAFT